MIKISKKEYNNLKNIEKWINQYIKDLNLLNEKMGSDSVYKWDGEAVICNNDTAYSYNKWEDKDVSN